VGSSGSAGSGWQLSPTQTISSLSASAGSAQLATAGESAITAHASNVPATVSLNRTTAQFYGTALSFSRNG
jgi:hypothetical protein